MTTVIRWHSIPLPTTGGVGAWLLRLGRTSFTLTENGEVYKPIFRFMARYVFGHLATIDAYLADLQTRLAGS